MSPDGKEVCYAANLDEDQALSTNSEIYTVPVEGGEPKKISTSPGADTRRNIRPTVSTSRGACRFERAMKATAGGW